MTTKKCALVVAHPGHELRVLHWVEISRPVCFVLSDGSGSGGTPRLAETTRILEQVGCLRGSIYGRFSDPQAYDIMMREPKVAVALANDLAEQLKRLSIERIVGDAAEGYNPVHDLCRVVINAACWLADLVGPAQNYEFDLTGPPLGRPGDIGLRLDDAAMARKIAKAKAYQGLGHEVEDALRKHGQEAFRFEYLRSVGPRPPLHTPFATSPYYEVHGESRVTQGIYQTVLRYQEHFLPVVAALQEEIRSRQEGLWAFES